MYMFCNLRSQEVESILKIQSMASSQQTICDTRKKTTPDNLNINCIQNVNIISM